MAKKSDGSLPLPKFQRNGKQKSWSLGERRTVNLLRTLWKAAGQVQRKSPKFLQLLVQLAWNNGPHGDSTRLWRNRKIAEYLKVDYSTDQKLAHNLHSQFRSLPISRCQVLIATQTGITWYRGAFRPGIISFVKNHSKEIAPIFRQVSVYAENPNEKVQRVAALIESLGKFDAAGKTVSPFNGLTPAISCLDPQRRFPIMNARTYALLKGIGEKANVDGIVALSKLIGPRLDIRDARELDAYVNTIQLPKLKRRISHPASGAGFNALGVKPEMDSIAHIAAGKTTITKLHHKLTNRLKDYLLGRHLTAKESCFDALVVDWKKGRDLLIEAKTAYEGTTGRTQIRQAIGQLFDYRFTYLPKGSVDLAILLPREPSLDIKKLLKSLSIEVLWFKGKQLAGTIQL